MTPIPSTTGPSRLRFQLREVLSVVVGYGMAALFFRAFWPAGGLPAGLLAPSVVLYLWLGLALSGPIILGRRGPRGAESAIASGSPTTPLTAATSRTPATQARGGSPTWAEWAWMFVGVYWIAIGLFVIPWRLHEFGPGDALLFGLVPILAAVVFRMVGSEPSASRAAPGWTHPAAVVLLLTWPVAWGCLIYLGSRLH
jgi:hypothetical protein